MENSDVKLLTVCNCVSHMCIRYSCCKQGVCDGWKWEIQREDQNFPSCGRTVMALKGWVGWRD